MSGTLTGPSRLALTPMHGVGGEYALDVFARAGLADVHVVESQFAPDPDFPTVPFPNPEEPGATDELLKLAADVEADVAIALDPDADRCAVGVPTPDGLAHAVGRRNRLAAGRLRAFSDRARRSDRAHRRGEHGGVVADAGRDRRRTRRSARRNADRLQVVVARRRRFTGLHAGLCLRGGDRLLRRPFGGSRQGRHQCGGVVLRHGRRAAGAGPHGARRAGRPGPPPRCAHHDRGDAARRRRRRSGGGDDAASVECTERSCAASTSR